MILERTHAALHTHGQQPDGRRHPAENTDPQRNAPGRCSHCGAQHYLGEPVTTTHNTNPCRDDPQTCTCCYCPECDAKSIYYRASKNPDYRCINCHAIFDAPITEWHLEHPNHNLYECLQCERVTRGP